MSKLWLSVSRVFLFAIFSLFIISATPTEAAIPLFGTSEEKDVEFVAADIIADGEDITIKGNFRNNTDNFQRVIGYTMWYQLIDDEGSIILSGAFRGENLSIEVGSELVPYSVTVKNKDIYDHHDINGWAVKSDVKIEK